MRNMLIIAAIWNIALYLIGGLPLVAGMFILNIALVYGARYMLRRAFDRRNKVIEHKA